jgi:hypothetical protein
MPTDKAVLLPEVTARDELVVLLPVEVECAVATPPVDTATALAEASNFRAGDSIFRRCNRAQYNVSGLTCKLQQQFCLEHT